MSTLLPFHKLILERIHDPGTNDLLVLARGLGLRRIICTLLKIYDSPKSLVLLVNASQEEESDIGEELGIMGCRKPGLRVVGYETGNKERQELYKQGGLISVTSRILVVDILQSNLPTQMITGLLVLHAEKVTPLALEAFIVRLYREKNPNGFLKAFTDEPEHITSGLSPLKKIMKELQLRNAHVYPRFQEDIKKSLERRRADVVELYQNLTDFMMEIHHAIIQCMTSTLSELKRSNTTLDLEDFNVENAYFRSFDVMVRRQLDPVWHKVGPKTKQLVNDLGTLRRLLNFLLTYDSLQFHSYLETLIASNTTTSSGGPKQHQSPWMLTDAANVIFQVAKQRCYLTTSSDKSPPPTVINLVDDDDEWNILDEIHGTGGAPQPSKAASTDADKTRPAWLPEGMEPVLEELPKWDLLSEVLQEIEEEIVRQERVKKPSQTSFGSDTVLIMTSSTRACNLINDFLTSMDRDAPKGAKGRPMMLRKLRGYLWWKSQYSNQKDKKDVAAKSVPRRHEPAVASPSPAPPGKDAKGKPERGSRRRVRGGAPSASTSTVVKKETKEIDMGGIQDEADSLAEFWATQMDPTTATLPPDLIENITSLDLQASTMLDEFDTHFGLLEPKRTILVRAYSDDSDDRVLAEIQPRFIVMFEPNMEFIRRIEVYRSSSPGLAIRVYHMLYSGSCEEHKYLAGIRREKESFEKLIKEKATMLLPISEERRTGPADALIQSISSRIAGGRREASSTPSQVIVDMREFRSTLPSLLHASNLLVIPATLTVGDYILTPDLCVERKSLTDLIASFNSGRLFTQCEMMSVYYKHPVLLIEFEEDKAFSLDIVSDLKSYVKPKGKYPPKKTGENSEEYSTTSLQSKIALLMLNFPRLRIIWSSSPYASAEIFNDLKALNAEPDPVKAIAVGAEEDPEAGAGINTAAEELLRCIPGITAKNIKYVMSKIESVRQLCEMNLPDVQSVLGVEPGKACYDFLHKGEAMTRV